jgi:hypothetical protein
LSNRLTLTLATGPTSVGLDNVVTHEKGIDEHADAEDPYQVAASVVQDHHSPVPNIERKYACTSQSSRQYANRFTAKDIVQADHDTAPASTEYEVAMHTDAMDSKEAVASAPTSPHPQDPIVASIEGKSLCPHRGI